jgi:hypothetical protein
MRVVILSPYRYGSASGPWEGVVDGEVVVEL